MLLAQRGSFLSRSYDAELQWIESSGTQWIDTGVKGSSSLRVEARVAWRNVAGYDIEAFQVDDGSTWTNGFGIQVTTNGARVRFVRGNQYVDASIYPIADNFYQISAGPSGMTINGNPYPITDVSSSFQTNYTMPLFGWRRSANVISNERIRLAYFKAWNGDELVRDLIPVRFTNEFGQSEAAMYDRVTGRILRNSGTGQLITGPDVGKDPYWSNKNAFVLNLMPISEPYDFHFTEGTFDWGSSVVRSALFVAAGSSSFTIDWGDGSPVEEYTSSTKDGAHHEYSSPGIYTVVMSDDLSTFSIKDCAYLQSILCVGHKNSLSPFYWAGVANQWNSFFANSPILSIADLTNTSNTVFAALLRSCPKLAILNLPDHATSIGDGVYSTWGGSSKISGKIILPSGLKNIKGNTFRGGNGGITSIVFPAGFEAIQGDYALYRQTFDIIMNPVMPPTCTSYALSEFNGKIYVPSDSVEAYKAAEVWSNFASKIYPISS